MFTTQKLYYLLQTITVFFLIRFLSQESNLKSVKTNDLNISSTTVGESNPMDECESFKKEYDKCFNAWFRDKFLKGIDDDSMCSDLLKNYTGCVKKAMKNRDIDIEELRWYHSNIGSKSELPKNN